MVLLKIITHWYLVSRKSLKRILSKHKTYIALLALLCSSCSRLPSAPEEQRLRERARLSPSRALRSRHRAISDSRHSMAPPSHTIRVRCPTRPTPPQHSTHQTSNVLLLQLASISYDLFIAVTAS